VSDDGRKYEKRQEEERKENAQFLLIPLLSIYQMDVNGTKIFPTGKCPSHVSCPHRWAGFRLQDVEREMVVVVGISWSEVVDVGGEVNEELDDEVAAQACLLTNPRERGASVEDTLPTDC